MTLLEENQRTFTKTCPGATTTNPRWNDSECNSGLRGKRPSTYSLSHDSKVKWRCPATGRGGPRGSG